jgi:phage terminase small subunit
MGKKRERKLTLMQQKFVGEYLLDLNATQAAIRAGYSKRSAEVQGYQLLQIPLVKAAVDKAMAAREKRTQIDADWVLRELAELYQANRTQIYKDGKLLPMSDWPPVLQRLLKTIRKGQIDFFGDPIKILELIGKHTRVGAFQEQVDLTGEIKLKVEYDEE